MIASVGEAMAQSSSLSCAYRLSFNPILHCTIWSLQYHPKVDKSCIVQGKKRNCAAKNHDKKRPLAQSPAICHNKKSHEPKSAFGKLSLALHFLKAN